MYALSAPFGVNGMKFPVRATSLRRTTNRRVRPRPRQPLIVNDRYDDRRTRDQRNAQGAFASKTKREAPGTIGYTIYAIRYTIYAMTMSSPDAKRQKASTGRGDDGAVDHDELIAMAEEHVEEDAVEEPISADVDDMMGEEDEQLGDEAQILVEGAVVI